MLKDRIYLIHSGSTIESLYTLFPLIVSQFNHLLVYVHIDSKEASMVSGKCAILIRVFKGNKLYTTNDQKKRDLIRDFRKRFDRIIILDDGAGSDSLHFEYIDLVDLYFKGKLLRDRLNYLRPMYGRQLFTDYYHQRFNIIDDNEKIRAVPDNPDVLKKLRISWNLGYGIYPIPGRTLVRLAKTATKLGFSKSLRPWFIYCYKQMIETLNKPVDITTKINKVQARFGESVLPETIGFQRKLFLKKCINSEAVLSGSVKSKLYNNEIKLVASVLSPFGWGEVCFRDFETIMNGGLLIKPDMNHLETWPDIYVKSKTYVPVDWDGDNLTDVIDSVSDRIADYRGIVEAGRTEYRKALLGLDSRVFHFLSEAVGANAIVVESDDFYSEQAIR
ncbi:hypothetical protein [Flavitalea sp.]|nr:hypothetical protein [Flavitalea sp.]